MMKNYEKIYYEAMNSSSSHTLIAQIVENFSDKMIEKIATISSASVKWNANDWNMFLNEFTEQESQKMLYEILLNNPDVPKDIAMLATNKVENSIGILQRSDLTKTEIMDILNKNVETPYFAIENENIKISPENIDTLCGLSTTALKKLHYKPFQRMTQQCKTFAHINEIVKAKDYDEELLTALINNHNLPPAIRNAFFSHGYIPEDIKNITPEMAESIYPEMVSLLYENNDNVNKRFIDKIRASFNTLVISNQFPQAYYHDFVQRQKDAPNRELETLFMYIAAKTNDSKLLSQMLELSDAYGGIKSNIIGNPAFDINCLKRFIIQL